MEAISAKEDVLTACVHELKSYITAISIYAGMIREDLDGKLSGDTAEAVDGICLYCNRMMSFVSDVISYSRAMDKPIVFERIELSDIIADCMKQLELIYFGQDIQLVCGELPSVWADKSLMRQAFYNILDNAVKYSSKREQTIISISSDVQDNILVVNISDNGVGFDNSNESPFELFSRLHSSREFEGTGVGLAIVKNVIERHNGTVEIHSNGFEGCTVTVSLPVHKGRKGRKNLSKG
ncbi:MAG: ATP-binding protein [Oscillospiraceae bacterium]